MIGWAVSPGLTQYETAVTAMEARAAAIAAARERGEIPSPDAGTIARQGAPPPIFPTIRPTMSDAALAFESEDRWASGSVLGDRRAWLTRAKDWLRHRSKRIAAGAGVAAALAIIWVVTTPADKGWVSITSEPAGAYVKVDGVLSSITPFGGMLPSGPHQIDVQYGNALRTQTVNVAKGRETVLHIELRADATPSTGALEITTEPAAGAGVWVDGTPRGNAPVKVDQLAPGSHDVIVKTARDSVTRKIDVQAGVVSSLIVSLNTAASPASGWLTVASPVRTQIFSGATLLGTTDTPRIMLPAGHYDLSLVNTDLGYRAEHSVQIASGQTSTLSVDIPKGTLFVNVLPWAEVWLDGQKVGDTPIGNLSVAVGRHELVVKNPELGEQRRTIVVSADTPVRVGLDLRK
jgi:hypothetical protein